MLGAGEPPDDFRTVESRKAPLGDPTPLHGNGFTPGYAASMSAPSSTSSTTAAGLVIARVT